MSNWVKKCSATVGGETGSENITFDADSFGKWAVRSQSGLYTITWDGDTTKKAKAYDEYDEYDWEAYRISNDFPAYSDREQLVGGEIVINRNGELITRTISSSDIYTTHCGGIIYRIAASDSGQNYIFFASTSTSLVKYCPYFVNTTRMYFLATGTYFVKKKDSSLFVSSLSWNKR